MPAAPGIAPMSVSAVNDAIPSELSIVPGMNNVRASAEGRNDALKNRTEVQNAGGGRQIELKGVKV